MGGNLIFLGVDPGLNGAFALIEGSNVVAISELPRFEKTLNVKALVNAIGPHAPAFALIERVGAMPGQGVASTFTFGCAYGACLATLALLGVPFELITPAKWKAHYRLSKSKSAARELATRLYPAAASELALVKHHGRAEALLLARHAQTLAKDMV